MMPANGENLPDSENIINEVTAKSSTPNGRQGGSLIIPPGGSSVGGDSENDDIIVPLSSLKPTDEQAGLHSKEEQVIKKEERDTANWLARGILYIFGAVSILILLFIGIGWLIDKPTSDTLKPEFPRCYTYVGHCTPRQA
jgi:hypothetical protein